MDLRQIEARLHRLLSLHGAGLPSEQIEEMKRLVAAGEPGIALENYCTQLVEYDLSPLPLDIVAELEDLGRAMGIDEKYTKRLRQH
jgi:hypothetical protein